MMDISYQSLFCFDLPSLKTLFSRLGKLIAIDALCCAYGDIRLAVDQDIPDVHLLDISYPENYLDHYLESQYHLSDPVIAGYLATLQPVNWNRSFSIENKKLKYLEMIDADSLGLRDGWTYGSVSPVSGDSAMFFLGTEEIDSSTRTKVILEYIIPFLSEAYKKILKKIPSKLLSAGNLSVTASEIEILNWLKNGKTSWEISVILNKSERVINFHINNVIKKLDAMNRTHAIVIALKNNLISI